MTKPLKAKELLGILERVVADHGDIDVYCDSCTLLDAGYSPEDNSFDMLSTGGLCYADETTYKLNENKE